MKKRYVWAAAAIALGTVSTVRSRLVENGRTVANSSRATGLVEQATAVGDISFEKNEGQVDGAVKFYARTSAGIVYLTDTETVLKTVRTVADAEGQRRSTELVLRSTLEGASASSITAEAPQSGAVNYLLGATPHAGVAHFGKVRRTETYPGIDVVYYGTGSELEYDFTLKPGAQPSKIRMKWKGQSSLHVSENGDLDLAIGDETVTVRAPLAYQMVNGERVAVPCQYVVLDAETGRRPGGQRWQ